MMERHESFVTLHPAEEKLKKIVLCYIPSSDKRESCKHLREKSLQSINFNCSTKVFFSNLFLKNLRYFKKVFHH